MTYLIQMLLNLHKKSWMEGLTLQDYSEHCKHNETIVKEMLELAKNYNKVRLEIIQQQIMFFLFFLFFYYFFLPYCSTILTYCHISTYFHLRPLKKRTK